MDSKPSQAWIFSAFFCNCLSCSNYCDDIVNFISFYCAVQKYETSLSPDVQEFRDPANVRLWNPESRIHGFRWNPGSISMEPVSLESGIHASGNGIHRSRSGIPWTGDLETEGHPDSFTYRASILFLKLNEVDFFLLFIEILK